MSNLVPEVRVNKNGVPVTKHVRPINKVTSGASVPAPVIHRSSEVIQKENRIKAILEDIRVMNGQARTHLESVLWNMEPDEFERIENLIQDDETDEWKRRRRNFMKDLLKEDKDDRTLCLNAVEAFSGDYYGWDDVRALKTMRNIPEFAPYAEDLREAPTTLIEGARRLGECRKKFGGATQLFRNTSTKWRVRNRELEVLLINSEEKSEALFQWAEKHTGKKFSDLDGDMALRVIRNPEERDEIAELMDRQYGNNGLVHLLLDRPDQHDEIFNLHDQGIRLATAISEVLDGNVKTTLSSGVL